jgi:hypothetical protein
MYVSIDFYEFDEHWINYDKYVIEAILMQQTNIRLPFYCGLTKTGDWVIVDTKPQCILTEKLNAKIYLYSLTYKGLKNKLLCKVYKITKFLLLKQILSNYFLQDVLYNIVYLSD